jgi:hypothetical protein
MKLFNLNKREEYGKTYWKSDDIEFHPRFAQAMLKISKGGYFNGKILLSCTLTTLIGFVGIIISPLIGWWFLALMLGVTLFIPWGKLYLKLPYDTGLYQCDTPTWGFYFYGEGKKIPDTFVICKGKKTKHFDLPWAYDWMRTSRMLKDETWLHERKGDRKKGIDHDWWSEATQAKLWKETHDYVYTLKSGEVQNRKATISVEEREWRPKWFRWTNLFAKVRTDIEIEFNEEVGERTGSWKGGTVGCSWELLPNEKPVNALRRMEKVRVFR